MKKFTQSFSLVLTVSSIIQPNLRAMKQNYGGCFICGIKDNNQAIAEKKKTNIYDNYLIITAEAFISYKTTQKILAKIQTLHKTAEKTLLKFALACQGKTDKSPLELINSLGQIDEENIDEEDIVTIEKIIGIVKATVIIKTVGYNLYSIDVLTEKQLYDKSRRTNCLIDKDTIY